MSREILDALVLAYFRGEVSQYNAAKMLEIRKSEFATLATDWAVELVGAAIADNPEQIEAVRHGVLWRAYLQRFLASFPDCDPRCTRRDTLPVADGDDLYRYYPKGEVTTYVPGQLDGLVPAQPSLGNRYPEAWDNRYMRSVMMTLARRDVEPDIEDDLSPSTSMDGLELDFNEAA